MELGAWKIPAVVVMAVSALFFPFWVTAAIFVLGAIFFENFYVGIIILFVMDALYGFETIRIGPFFGLLSVFGILAYFLIRFVRERSIASS